MIRAGVVFLCASLAAAQSAPPASPTTPATVSATQTAAVADATELHWEQEFLKIPNVARAGADLKTLTAAPHVASSPEDYATALFVAKKFRAAGLETTIVPYRVMLNFPKTIRVTATDASGAQIMSGPTPEQAAGDPYLKDPRIVAPFNSSSLSADVTADVVYVNYGRPEDFKVLADHHIDVRGKILIARYGENFRGIKAYLAQLHGAAGILLYSDPADNGYVRGDTYPQGPYLPDTGVQRGSIQYLFESPGDPTTPGFASTLDLPASRRIALDKTTSQPQIASTPLSAHDASPILAHLDGPESPRSWQGGLPFTYHLGPGPVKVHMLLLQDYALRTIWDVIGKVPGTTSPDAWVVAGNHRDAWVFGAVDPNSGTAAMLEAVRGVGALLHQGWKPRRSILFASWDGEEAGLIGSTEWVEQHPAELRHAVAYFNMDVGVAGPNFSVDADPALQPFIVSITKQVPSPQGGTVYDAWKNAQQSHLAPTVNNGFNPMQTDSVAGQDVHIGNLGSGSDFTPFFQHAGVPATDITSDGPYGVYHSAFDNYAWFVKFADPNFLYLQQQARIFGLEAIRMADDPVLPYDDALYGSEIVSYVQAAQKKAAAAGLGTVNFNATINAANRFRKAGADALAAAKNPATNPDAINTALRAAEEDLLVSAGLPHRPWYKHTIYAPGEFTGYAAVVIPGVNEALDKKDAAQASQQLTVLTRALNRAATTLEKISTTK